MVKITVVGQTGAAGSSGEPGSISVANPSGAGKLVGKVAIIQRLVVKGWYVQTIMKMVTELRLAQPSNGDRAVSPKQNNHARN